MPIPVLIWAAVAAGGALTAWHFRKEIAEFFNSPAGQRLLNDLGEAAKGAMEPYQRLVDEAYPMNSTKRREFFRQAKAKMGRTDWVAFVGYDIRWRGWTLPMLIRRNRDALACNPSLGRA